MKGKIRFLGALSLLMVTSVGLFSPAFETKSKAVPAPKHSEQDFKGASLTIYNSSDYIDDSLIDEFEERYNCRVNYYTFDTNETMYNQFTLQPEGTYDLICTSDYMIQRMVREGLLQSFDIAEDCPVYDQYASQEVRGKLKGMLADTDGDGVKDTSLDAYAAGYMWGTLGIIYDPFCSDTIREDVRSWNVFWDEQYKNLISIKNSMRDTFVVGLMHAYSGSPYSDVDDLAVQAREVFLKEMESAVSEEERDAARDKYNGVIQSIFDLVITEEDYKPVLETVKKELISLKKNIFGLEVDSGKNDIITGKIKMNLAWSGDAVYSIDVAMEQQGKVLEYYVPEEGGNVWYDAWGLPKGANKELACRFIDFLSEPENAARNMDYIGYTSFITCDEVLDLVTSWYGIGEYYEGTQYTASYVDEDGEEVEGSVVAYEGEFYACIQDSLGNLPTDGAYFEKIEEDLELDEAYDLSYLFSGNIDETRNAIVYPYAESANQLQTQYPDKDTLARCAVMNDFESANDDVVIMWGQIKAYTNMTPYYVILIICVSGVLVATVYTLIRKRRSIRNKRRLSSISSK